MNPEDFVEIGYVSKTHGMEGEVKLVFEVKELLDFIDVPVYYLKKEKGPIQPMIIEALRLQSEKQGIAKFEGVEDRDEAKDLVGSTLLFPEEELPELEDGHFYYFEVIGFSLVDKNLGKLGTIKNFADGNAHDIMIMDYQGHEVLVPVVDHIVGLADFEKEEVSLDLPEGLLELYMGEEEEEEEEEEEK